jgi:hypothetical protein
MPVDYIYTSGPEEHPTYHVLYRCPEAGKIEREHRMYGPPPAEDGRTLCSVCLAEITDWLRSLRKGGS